MKKTVYFGFVILTALFSVSASVWEGAASVSLNGELPETGYYAATRSFPRNTIVDITNLETGQTIRVIVASGLDSPGLLAILSKEAASAIGLPIRSVGRIRMTMPSDPVAFSRFPDEISSSGDPDFDPLAAITAAGDLGFDVKQAAETIKQDSSKTDNTIASRPIAPNPAAANIVDLPDPYTTPQERERDNPVKSEPVPAGIYGYSPEPVPPETDIAWNDPPASPPAVPQPVLPDTAPRTSGILLAKPTLVPAEPRPPTSPFRESLPSAEIPPIGEPAPEERASAPPARAEPVLEPLIPPLKERASAPPARAEPVLEPLIPSLEERASVPPARAEPVLEPLIPPLEERASAPLPATPVVRAVFSVPVINRLEKGKYYLQLAAYTLPELVEDELSRIGGAYPRSIQESGNPDKPMYRILIGPVNLGESGALLRRFKASGYKDAFVRKEG
jgi:hypothetical protein